MKKVLELIKPFLLIILGALLLLVYLNNLQGQDAALAMGIVGLIIAVYYLGLGIVRMILGDKLPKLLAQILDLVAVAIFPVFLFVGYLINVIELHDYFGPTGWVIIILSMIAALGLAGMYVVAFFLKGKLFCRIAQLCGMAFIMVLLLNLAFNIDGTLNTLGNIPLVLVAIYLCYSIMLFRALGELGGAAAEPAPAKEEPKEEKPAEEQPEEKPAE